MRRLKQTVKEDERIYIPYPYTNTHVAQVLYEVAQGEDTSCTLILFSILCDTGWGGHAETETHSDVLPPKGQEESGRKQNK